MGKSAKLQNSSCDGYKRVAFIDRGNGNIELSPILYGIFKGKKSEVGTWQALRKGNVVVSRRTGDTANQIFRVKDNDGGMVQVNNSLITSTFYKKVDESIVKFLENNDLFLNKTEEEWVVNINKKKKMEIFSRKFGVNVSKKVLMLRKDQLNLIPIPEPDNLKKTGKETIYQSDGMGGCMVVNNFDDIPSGMYMIIKTGSSINTYIKMSKEKMD